MVTLFSITPSTKTSLAGPGLELLVLTASFPISAVLLGVGIFYSRKKVAGLGTSIFLHGIWTVAGLSLTLYIALL